MTKPTTSKAGRLVLMTAGAVLRTRGNEILIHAPVVIEFPMTLPDLSSHLPSIPPSIAPRHGFQAHFNLREERITFVSPKTGRGYLSIPTESKAISVAL